MLDGKREGDFLCRSRVTCGPLSLSVVAPPALSLPTLLPFSLTTAQLTSPLKAQLPLMFGSSGFGGFGQQNQNNQQQQQQQQPGQQQQGGGLFGAAGGGGFGANTATNTGGESPFG